MKYIYKILFLILLFLGSVYFMSKNIREISVSMDALVEMQQARLPIVILKSQGYSMNLLHGYSSNLSDELFRENVTPIDAGKELGICINEYETPIIRLKYEIRDVETGELLENNSISALNQEDGVKNARISLSCAMENGKEYTAKITLTSQQGRKVYYYTRLKYYEGETNINKKMDFVQSIHEAAFKKEEGWKQLAIYMEPEAGRDNTSLSRVTIHSSLGQMTWGKMEPVIVSEIVPQITEYTIETGSVVYEYFVKADAGSGKEELFRVRECFRVRYNTEQIYLLDYERTMEARFDMDLVSINQSEFKIGISDINNIDVISSADNARLAFVRQGELWYYNMAENKAVRVFTFLSDKNEEDYIRSSFDQHSIRVTNMADNGEMDFLVYGYMNRGDYEGKVGIILYHFYPEELRIKELAYIPVDIPYQRLRESLDNFGYVNSMGDFYFSIDGVIYQYNTVSRRLDKLAENIRENNFISVQGKEGHYIVWLDEQEPGKAKSMNFLDLDTEEKNTFEAPLGCGITLFVSIDENVVFGYSRDEDLINTIYGGIVVPCYEICIADKDCRILKTYSDNGCYVTRVTAGDNVLELERIEKRTDGIGYKEVRGDNIINNVINDEDGVHISTRLTEKAEKEHYLSLPSGFEMVEKPKNMSTKNTVITEDTTLRVTPEKSTADEYYVYAYGEIKGIFSEISDAVLVADDCMGNVVWNGNVLWERGSKAILANIPDIEVQGVPEGSDSISACISILLKNEGITIPSQEIYRQNKSICDILSQNFDNVYNLTGCGLEEVLYYVGKNCPVIAVDSHNEGVLITGYDSIYLHVIDPLKGEKENIRRDEAAKKYEREGNVFVGYLKDL